MPSLDAVAPQTPMEGEVVAYRTFKNEEDLPTIMRLVDEQLSEPYSIFTYRYFVSQWPHLCRLAFSGEACVGTIVCKQELGRSVARGYIAMLVVVKEFRGKGIATRLVESVVAEMQRGGCEEVVLEAEVTNEGALALYGNLGFLRAKRLHRYYLNGVDAFRLKLRLSPLMSLEASQEGAAASGSSIPENSSEVVPGRLSSKEEEQTESTPNKYELQESDFIPPLHHEWLQFCEAMQQQHQHQGGCCGHDHSHQHGHVSQGQRQGHGHSHEKGHHHGHAVGHKGQGSEKGGKGSSGRATPGEKTQGQTVNKPGSKTTTAKVQPKKQEENPVAAGMGSPAAVGGSGSEQSGGRRKPKRSGKKK